MPDASRSVLARGRSDFFQLAAVGGAGSAAGDPREVLQGEKL
jgi:hypothetical protein